MDGFSLTLTSMGLKLPRWDRQLSRLHADFFRPVEINQLFRKIYNDLMTWFE